MSEQARGVGAGATRARDQERAMWRYAYALTLLWLTAERVGAELDAEGLSSAKFLMGSRYGRSPARTHMLSPRNDRRLDHNPKPFDD